MNLIDKDALIESLGIETDCYDCEHERMKYHCDLDPVEACTKIVEAPVISVTTESAEKAIEVLKNAAWLGAVYSFEETEEAVKTAIRALQVASAQPNVQDSVKDADCISRTDAIDAISKIKRTDNWQAAVSMALLDLPSAQPDPNCSEIPNNSDTISRQAAIEALRYAQHRFTVADEAGGMGNVKWSEDVIYFAAAERVLSELPSAQPEERKESLCKKVRALCEESKIEFFFVGGGESTWSVTNDKHIKKIVECHKAQLSQEDTTKDATSDTISRQAAIDALENTKEVAR